MVLTMQCCLTVTSIGPHAIASFLDRCLLEMDMAHAIPAFDPIQTCRKVGSFDKN